MKEKLINRIEDLIAYNPCDKSYIIGFIHGCETAGILSTLEADKLKAKLYSDVPDITCYDYALKY